MYQPSSIEKTAEQIRAKRAQAEAKKQEPLQLNDAYRKLFAGMAEGNTLVTYPMFSEWGITEDELYEIAYENSFKVMPEIMSMSTLMRQMLSKEDVELEIELALEMHGNGNEYMYVCGHKVIAGAACILNNELLKKFIFFNFRLLNAICECCAKTTAALTIPVL